MLFKQFDERRNDYTGPFEVEAMESFVSGHSLPLVTTFSRETAPKIFGGNIRTHLLVFADSEQDSFDDLFAGLETVAKEYRSRALVIHVPPSEAQVMNYFGLEEGKYPPIHSKMDRV